MCVTMKQFIILASLFVFVATEAYFPWDPRAKRERNDVFFLRGNSERYESSLFYPDTHGRTRAQIKVNEIKDLLFRAEQKMQKLCGIYTERPLKEAYGVKHYRLYANMTGCREAGLEVRAGQRLVAVQAKDSRCDSISMRMLPDAVNSNSAFWRFKNGQINIFFPYNSERRRCGRVISGKIHRVPKFEDDIEDPDIDVRFGDDELGRALETYSENHEMRRTSDYDWDD